VGPTGRGRALYISFSTGYPHGSRWEKAVGARCHVIRHTGNQTWDCSGVVLTVRPRVMVALDAPGWQPIAGPARPRRGVFEAPASRQEIDHGADPRERGARGLRRWLASQLAGAGPTEIGLFESTELPSSRWSRTGDRAGAVWRRARGLSELAWRHARERAGSERERAEHHAALVADYRARAIDAEAFGQPGIQIDSDAIYLNGRGIT
jgi:hypothetical protein